MRSIPATTALLIAVALGAPAGAHEGHEHKNLKVLAGVPEKKLDEGMKSMAKGLGVKCTACHIDKHWDKDEKKTKLEARAFFEKVVAGPEDADRKIALDALVHAVGLKNVRDEALIWQAVALFRHERKEH
ncbi:MAG: hypothetical protein IT384_19125 [Deltaproteobacteria bacterium]|nr:hypothetical protein [Deltaproteobacteria bacterium]